MAIVFLKRDLFDVNGNLWHARNNPHEIEDEAVLAGLPTDATVDGVKVSDRDKKLSAEEKAEAKDLKKSGEQAVEESKREDEIVQNAEAEHNDKAHAAVVKKTATPPKL